MSGHAPSAADLSALLEEKNRLQARLRAKQAAQAAALSAPKQSPQRGEALSREAGFNTHINGANEERIAEQRRREKAAAAAQAHPRRTDGAPRTWAKPTPHPAAAAAAQSNPSSARTAARGEHDAHHSQQRQQQRAPEPHHSDNDGAAPAASPVGAGSAKPKRKQWTTGPVHIMGADEPSLPLYSSGASATASRTNTHRSDRPDDHEHDDGGGGDDHADDHDDRDSEPDLPNSHRHFGGDEASAEDLLSMEAPAPEAYDDDDFAPAAAAADEEAAAADGGAGGSNEPPMSPPPLALRKKDVSLLRASLEMLSQPSSKPAHMLSPKPAAPTGAAAGARQHHAPPPAISTFSIPLASFPQELMYDLTPHDVPPAAAASSIEDEFPPVDHSLEKHELHDLPAGMPRPASSSSPTLPTRTLGGGSASSRRAAALAAAAAPSAAPAAAQVVHLRTSVSYAGEDEIEDETEGGAGGANRPVTPQGTDNSTLRTSLLLSQSFDKGAVESMLFRLRLLSKSKRAVLLKVLAKLERGDAGEIPADLKASLEIMGHSSTTTSQAHAHGHTELADRPRDPALPLAKKAEPKKTQVAAAAAAAAVAPIAKTIANEVPASAVAAAAAPPAASPVGSKLSLLKQKQQQAAAPGASVSPPPLAAAAVSARAESPAAAAAAAGDDEIVVASFAPPAPTLTVRCFSTHGHPHLLGLAQMELADASGTRMRVPPSAVHFAWTTGHPNAAALGPTRGDVGKLVSAPPASSTAAPRRGVEDKFVWSMPFDPEVLFPLSGSGSGSGSGTAARAGFELQIYLPSFFAPPGVLSLFNYTRGGPSGALLEGNKGLREVEVLVGGHSVWKGELARARDNGEPQRIALIPGLQIPASLTASIGSEKGETKPAAPVAATVAPRAAEPSASARPVWLQGAAGAAAPSSAATSPEPIVPAAAPAPTLGHSASASGLTASRRRGSQNSMLGLGRDNVQTAGAAAPEAASGAMVPPLLPASTWDAASDMPVPIKQRPMSGRRAMLPPSGAAGSAAPAAAAAAGPAAGSGRRRPSIDGLGAPSAATPTSSQPSSRGPSPSPESQQVLAPAAAAAAAPAVRRSNLEQSWDSLEHFKHNHHGRLPPADAVAAAEPAAEASKPVTSASKSASSLQLPSPPAPISTAEALASDRKRHSRNSSVDPAAFETDEPSSATAAAAADDDAADSPTTASSPVPAFFPIPTLPRGRKLTLNLLSTWGDHFYVGLNGIEIFDGRGTLLTFPPPQAAKAIRASPADLNVLPGYSNDPRVVSNLLDGINGTTDDMHSWLAPFSRGKNHVIVIDLAQALGNDREDATTVSFLRIWPYNKSRIHSQRGAKYVEMFLDQTCIFKGEIAQASGSNAPEDSALASENILFTTEPATLARIAAQTQRAAAKVARESVPHEMSLASEAQAHEIMHTQARPLTGEGQRASHAAASIINVQSSVDLTVARPKTSAVPHLAPAAAAPAPIPAPVAAPAPAPALASKSVSSRFSLLVTELTFHLVSTWGDPYFVGLTGLEILDPQGRSIALSYPGNLDAFPRDINTVPGHSGDNRTLDKLVNGDNVTMSDNSMWLAPVLQPEEGGGGGGGGKKQLGEQWLKVRFATPQRVSAFRVYNYNKSEEDTYRGMRCVRLTALLSGASSPTLVSPSCGFFLRKAPGNTDFDFGQTVHLADPRATEAAMQTALANLQNPPRKPVDATLPLCPTGFLLKLLLLSSQGDAHYIGLNGIELYDHNANKIAVTMQNLTGVPSSLNDLSPSTADSRTLDKLLDGVNDTYDDRHMWLAPIAAAASAGASATHHHNVLYLSFDAAVTLGAIRLWNYSKTPTRGVKALQILLDQSIIYEGVLKPAPPAPAAGGGSKAGGAGVASFAHNIVFCAHPAFAAFASSVPTSVAASPNEVLLVDERRFLTALGPGHGHAPPVPANKTHAQVAAANASAAGRNAGAVRPMTMARGAGEQGR